MYRSVPGAPARPSVPINKKPNMVGKPGETGQSTSEHGIRRVPSVFSASGGKNGFSLLPDKVNNFKQTDKLPVLKPKVPPATAKPTKPERKQTTTFAPTTAGTKDPLCSVPGRRRKKLSVHFVVFKMVSSCWKDEDFTSKSAFFRVFLLSQSTGILGRV